MMLATCPAVDFGGSKGLAWPGWVVVVWNGGGTEGGGRDTSDVTGALDDKGLSTVILRC